MEKQATTSQVFWQQLRRAQRGESAAIEELVEPEGALAVWLSTRLPRRQWQTWDVSPFLRECIETSIVASPAVRDTQLWWALRQSVLARVTIDSSELDDNERETLEALAGYEAALAALDEAEREAIAARIEMGGDYEQMMALLGKASTGAARMAMCRALLRLAEKMT